MPELPEVENVVRSIAEDFKFPLILKKFTFFRKDLRWPFEKSKLKKIENQTVLSLARRAKYILFQFEDYALVSHLGMTGQWRALDRFENTLRKKHDHVLIEFDQGMLVYNDPRRFGFLQLVKASELKNYFSQVGDEPFQPLTETAIKKIKRAERSIKSVLLDQKIVVGIGNIYACEALFRAKIKPQTKAKSLSIEKIRFLYRIADEILSEAIQAGGSSISDYTNSREQKGEFQNQHLVYGREGEPCSVCGKKIQRLVQSGRSTFWCKTCQK